LLLGLLGSLQKFTNPRNWQVMILASIWLAIKTYQFVTFVHAKSLATFFAQLLAVNTLT
jgi:hypothetical protein